MGDKSAISWTDATLNPVTGCSKVSPGCQNCYAERIALRKMQPYDTGLPWTAQNAAQNVKLHPARLEQVLRWKKPRHVFVNSMSDLFHEQVPEEFIDRVFAVMALSPRHTFQLLTKRPERMLAYLGEERGWIVEPHATRNLAVIRGMEPFIGKGAPFAGKRLTSHLRGKQRLLPLPNVWLGVSVEDQRRADERIPLLLQTPAAVRFLSAEPLLGPISLQDAVWPLCIRTRDGHEEHCDGGLYCDERSVDWVIVGGESGPGARPMHPGWARSIRDQCVEAGVAFHFKQWGEWAPGVVGDPVSANPPKDSFHVWDVVGPERLASVRVGKKAAGRELDGRTWDEMPERAEVR